MPKSFLVRSTQKKILNEASKGILDKDLKDDLPVKNGIDDVIQQSHEGEREGWEGGHMDEDPESRVKGKNRGAV